VLVGRGSSVAVAVDLANGLISFYLSSVDGAMEQLIVNPKTRTRKIMKIQRVFFFIGTPAFLERKHP
jgi:hypothetical protein